MNKVETTYLKSKKFRNRFRFYEIGHLCKYKNQKNVKYATTKELICCDCSVYYHRVCRWWYKPIYILGNKLNKYMYKKIAWINNNIILQ